MHAASVQLIATLKIIKRTTKANIRPPEKTPRYIPVMKPAGSDPAVTPPKHMRGHSLNGLHWEARVHTSFQEIPVKSGNVNHSKPPIASRMPKPLSKTTIFFFRPNHITRIFCDSRCFYAVISASATACRTSNVFGSNNKLSRL